MTTLYSDPARFADDALRGFVDANAGDVRRVPGGVVRRRPTRAGKVAVAVGGGSGHYPAFYGLVGEGLADAAVVGNVFTSPSADDVVSVARHADGGAGVLLLTGNYAGDVMNFTLACERLATGGTDARYLVVTDDIASAPVGEEAARRGIAGGLMVFKAAAAAATRGDDLDAVERVARHANDRTRTLGVAFDGCTLPGGTSPLFTVAGGSMGIGVGIHGEPGIGEVEMPDAPGLADLLVSRVLAEAPSGAGTRVAAILNGLGRTKYEELFVLWASVSDLLRENGLTVVEPEVGELVTSLDMAGCSLTLMWLDEDLERLWRAPASAPAYRKGVLSSQASDDGPDAAPEGEGTTGGAAGSDEGTAGPAGDGDEEWPPADERSCREARRLLAAIETAADELVRAETELGRLDAVAGDGDHGRGMVRGVGAAQRAAAEAVGAGLGADATLVRAGRAWSGEAGGTSGIVWGAMLEAAGRALPDDDAAWRAWDAHPVQGVADTVAAAIAAARAVGKAEVGDKTLLDALVPFLDALREAPDGDVGQAWARAAATARAAAAQTAALRPRVGRARPLAERSIGHPDPGATSLALIVTAVSDNEQKKG